MDTRELLETEAEKLQKRLDSLGRKRDRLDQSIAEVEKKLGAISVVLGEVLGSSGQGESSTHSSTKPARTRSGGTTLTDILKQSLAMSDIGIVDFGRLLKIAETIDESVEVTKRNMTKTLARLMSDAGDEVLVIDDFKIVLREPGRGAKAAVYEKISNVPTEDDLSSAIRAQGRMTHERYQHEPVRVEANWRRPAHSNQPS